MSGKLRVGITGSGGIAGAHAGVYKANEQTELVACCDIDLARAQAFAQQWGLKAYGSQDEMLRAGSLDIVSLCTQPRSHMPLGIAALEADVNLFCEKPLALTSDEGRAMAAAARVAGRKLMVAVCHRFHEPIIQAKAMLTAGKLGEYRGYYNAFVGKVKTHKDRGGVLLDNGSHAVDFYRFLAGEPKRVCAVVNPQSDDITDATEVWALIESQDGVPGTINLSFDVEGGAAICALYGSEGTAVVDYSGDGLRYQLAGKDWVTEKYDLPYDHRFHREIAHFVDCVLNDTEPGPNGDEGVKDLELIEAIWRAARGCA
jgi:UDP-N-acetylglucosamine 3-dehydrogenase